VAQQDVHAENTTYFAHLLVGNVEVLAVVIKYDLHLSLRKTMNWMKLKNKN